MAAPRTSTIVYNHTFNPSYDIVWSVQFLLSGNNNSSGAFTTFLSVSSTTTTPGSGADVGYSGSIGLSGAKLAIGFDTTGLFASPLTYPDSTTRDGTTPRSNMLVIRGGYPDFNLIFAAPLSALSDSFNLLSFNQTFQTLRFRLGNVGRTIYIDWRPSDNTSYTQLTAVNVNLNINDNDLFYVGYSFTTPVSTTIGWNESFLYLKHPVFEGGITTPTYKTLEFEPITTNLCDDCLIPTIYTTVSAEIPLPPNYGNKIYLVYTDCREVDQRLLYSTANTNLFNGPLYLEQNFINLFDGSFVFGGNLYAVTSGIPTLSGTCGAIPYEPEIPVLFVNPMAVSSGNKSVVNKNIIPTELLRKNKVNKNYPNTEKGRMKLLEDLNKKAKSVNDEK